jgi:cell division protein FtsL
VRRRRAGLLTAAACTALFAVMLGLVAFQMRIAQGQGRLDRLERDIRAEELRYDRLRLEVARLQSPEQVVAAAKALGMVEPDAITYVVPPADVVAAADAAVGGAPPGAAPVGGSPWGAVKPVLGAAP